MDLDAVRASRERLAALAREHPELVGDSGPANVAAWERTLLEESAGMAEVTKQIAFRLSASLVERLDRHAEKLSRESPGLNVTRADVVRMLLLKGLDEAEAPRRSGG